VKACYRRVAKSGGSIWRGVKMTSMTQFIAAVLVLITFVAAGCSRTTPAAAPASATYHYELRNGDSRQFGTSENVDAQSGDITLSIQAGRLTVNGKDYGQLNDGDCVLADDSGDVVVNGAPRRPKN